MKQYLALSLTNNHKRNIKMFWCMYIFIKLVIKHFYRWWNVEANEILASTQLYNLGVVSSDVVFTVANKMGKIQIVLYNFKILLEFSMHMVFLRQKKNLSNKFWIFTDVRLNVCSCNLNINKAVEDIPILKKKYLAFSYSILRNSLYMAKDIISEIIYGRFVSNLLITHPSLLHEMVIESEFLTQRNQNFKWAFLINIFRRLWVM